jgi:glycosyltransferase involved in cell wall biosynthesis
MLTVSAVIPVHNGAAYVAEAIESVLAQTYRPLECLVIDDGSTDATAEVVGRFAGVAYVRLDHGGQSRARNRGTQLARGELIAFLDHDDVWLPEKLEHQVAAFRRKPEATMVLCAMEVVDESGHLLGINRLVIHEPQELISAMVTFNGTDVPGCNQAAVVRRDWLLDNGGYDPILSISGDWDLLLRTLLGGSLAYVDEPLVRYRVRESGLHRNATVMERDMRYAFAKAFADPRLPRAVRGRRRHAYARLYRMVAGSYRDIGDRNGMARAIAQALRHEPRLAFEPLTRGRRRLA